MSQSVIQPRRDAVVVDVFNHVYPDEYLDVLPKPLHPSIQLAARATKNYRDLDYRIKMMDRLGIDMHVLSLGRPSPDDSNLPASSYPKLSRAGNDGIARIVEKYPDRFAAVGTVSMLDVGAAIDELDRCVKDLGLLGVQVLTNAGGKPIDSQEFEAFYDRLEHHDVVLLIHPTDLRKIYDWASEFDLNVVIGWDVDTSFAMYRIARSGVFERHPKLKIITHHMGGALIPFLANRIDRTIMAMQGRDGKPPAPLTKRPMEYLKMFYVDTAEGAWMPAMVCSQMFFGSSHMLFASDYPFHGEDDLENTIRTIWNMSIPDEEKKMILGENALRLFKIKR